LFSLLQTVFPTRRPNILVAGGPAFAEDRWARVVIDDITLACDKPCGRCTIPTIDPASAVRAADAQPFLVLKKLASKKNQNRAHAYILT
jgi:uncharacterized protein YcbX